MPENIHTTAVVHEGAKLGTNVTIGPFSIVHSTAEIGENTVIGSHCVIAHPAPAGYAGRPLVIGPNSVIRAHTVIYEGSTFGERLEIGHHVLLREGTEAGRNLRAGVFVDVEGRCTIGDYCRLHSAAIVGQASRLGDFVWMYPYTVLPNDPLPPSPLERGCTVGSGAVLCTAAILQPGTVLGEGAYVTAQSFAKGNVPAGAVVTGLNGRIITHVTKLFSREGRFRHPWMRNVGESYPEEAQEALEALRKRIEDSVAAFNPVADGSRPSHRP